MRFGTSLAHLFVDKVECRLYRFVSYNTSMRFRTSLAHLFVDKVEGRLYRFVSYNTSMRFRTSLAHLFVDKVEGGESGLVPEAEVRLMPDKQVHSLRVPV